MGLANLLHMNGGSNDNSYAKCSSLQRNAMAMAKEFREEAIAEVYNTMFIVRNNKIETITIADLGCGSGPNALMTASEFVKTIKNLSKKHGKSLPEVHVHLNDLSGNDFNMIFQTLLPQLQEDSESFFVSAVAGSFYSRLFPAKSLHFANCANSLMWLSKVPEGIEENKEYIYVARGSPKSVTDAYSKQFQSDFLTFLTHRSKEMVPGGRMVLNTLGRKNKDYICKDSSYAIELLALALKHMVSEGYIEEEKFPSFHMPSYPTSIPEIKMVIEKEGSFTINHLKGSEMSWKTACASRVSSEKEAGYSFAKCMRSVTEALLIEHFGQSVMDKVFDKYTQFILDQFSREDHIVFSISVSLTRRD